MKYTRGLLPLQILIAMTGSANAFTGNDLLKDCSQVEIGSNTFTTSSVEDAYARGRCTAYIDGVVDLAFKVPFPTGICVKLPAGVEYSQMRFVVIKWLRDHPEQLQDPAAVLIYRALQAAWPCQQQ